MKIEVYKSSLSVEECLRRISKFTYTTAESLKYCVIPPRKETIFAVLKEKEFSLACERPWYSGNSFGRFFYGRIERAEKKTKIIGKFKLHRYMRVFMTIILLIVSVFSLSYLKQIILGEDNPDGSTYIALGILLAFILFNLLLIQFGKLKSKKQMQKIREFIQTEFEARLELGTEK